MNVRCILFDERDIIFGKAKIIDPHHRVGLVFCKGSCRALRMLMRAKLLCYEDENSYVIREAFMTSAIKKEKGFVFNYREKPPYNHLHALSQEMLQTALLYLPRIIDFLKNDSHFHKNFHKLLSDIPPTKHISFITTLLTLKDIFSSEHSSINEAYIRYILREKTMFNSRFL